MAGAAEELLIFLRANTAQFSTKFAEAEAQVQGFSTNGSGALNKFAALGGASLAVAGAGLAVVGVASVKAADDFEKSHTRLENAVRNAGLAFSDEKGKVDAQDRSMEKLGFTYDDTENSLSRLVTATGSVSKAQRDQGVAADLAAARGISLQSATDLLVKVESGRYTQLGRPGIATKEQIKGFTDSGQAVDFLSNKYKGSASAAAETFGGKVRVLKATVTDIAVSIGQKLIPVIESLASGLADTIHWFEENSAVAKILGGVVAAVLVPAMVTFLALKVQAFAETLIGGFRSMASGAEFLTVKLGLTSGATETAGAAAETAGGQVAAGGAEAETGGAGFATAGEEAAGSAAGFETAGAAAQAAGAQVASAGTEAGVGGAGLAEAGATGAGGLATIGTAATAVLAPLAAVQVISGGALTDFSTSSDVAAKAAKGWADQVVDASKRTTGGLGKARDLYRETGKTADDLKTKHDLLTHSLADGTWQQHGKTMLDVQHQIEKTGEAADVAKGRHQALGDAIDRAKHADQQAVGPLNDHGRALDRLRTSLDAANTAQDKERDATIASFSSDLAAQQSVQALSKDIDNHADSLTLQQDALDAASARVTAWSDAVTASGGAPLTASQKADIFRGSLIQLGQQFPGLQPLIQAYIDKLGQVPPDVNTDVTVTGIADAEQSLRNLIAVKEIAGHTLTVPVSIGNNGAPIGRNAGGGYVAAGAWSWVGENGPELVHFGSSATVVPNDKSMAMVGAASPAAVAGAGDGGGDTYILNLSAVDARGMEDLVVGALERHVRRRGHGQLQRIVKVPA